jgi:uncharacterized protein (TIGR00299 family) protein
MRSAHFDPVTGASGDMILAALVDAGAPLGDLRAGLSSLPVPAFRLDTEEVRVRGFRARRLVLEIPDEKDHRHLPEVKRILAGGSLPAPVVGRANEVFERLAEAEARSHGIPAEKVHFHEVGALDAILDIAGACLALHLLEVDTVTFSPLRLGTGEVDSAHGRIPVPVPAVLELTRGVPTVRTDVRAELLTPTGAAILTTLGRPEGGESALVAEAVGVGAGTRELEGRPNVLRVTVGTRAAAPDAGGIPWETDEVVVLEANLDDMSGELLPGVIDAALDAGALDAWLTPIIMKKGRPAHVVSVIAEPARAEPLAALLLRETTTFGVRRHACARRKLARRFEELATPWGPVRVKIGNLGGGDTRVTPEYESCREIAIRAGLPLHRVVREVEDLIRSSEWMQGGE